MRYLRLADEEYYKPSLINLLLGADPFVASSGPNSSLVGHPIALETIFGYVLKGPVRANNSSSSCTVIPSLETLVHQF